MEKLCKILMDRDGVTHSEAMDMVLECREAMENGNYEALLDYLGLEDDYIFDLLGDCYTLVH